MLTAERLPRKAKYAKVLLIEYALSKHVLDQRPLLGLNICFRHISRVFQQSNTVEVCAQAVQNSEGQIREGNNAPGLCIMSDIPCHIQQMELLLTREQRQHPHEADPKQRSSKNTSKEGLMVVSLRVKNRDNLHLPYGVCASYS